MSEGDEGESSGALDMLDSATAESAADAVISAFTTPEPAGPSGASIKVAVETLKPAIIAAFKSTKLAAHGVGNGAGPDAHSGADPIIEALGDALGNAIHAYFTSAWVDITAVQSVAMPPVFCETVGIPPVRPVAAGAIIVPIIPVHHTMPDPISGQFYGKLK